MSFYVKEALLNETNDKLNILISSIPLVGLIFIINKEYSTSIKLLSAIKNADTQTSIKLINVKNCCKIYSAIHWLVLGILSIPVNGFYGAILLVFVSSIKFGIDIYRSGRILDKIQKLNYSFVVINDEFHPLPRMRSLWFSKIVPWIECGLQNNLTYQFHHLTIY